MANTMKRAMRALLALSMPAMLTSSNVYADDDVTEESEVTVVNEEAETAEVETTEEVTEDVEAPAEETIEETPEETAAEEETEVVEEPMEETPAEESTSEEEPVEETETEEAEELDEESESEEEEESEEDEEEDEEDEDLEDLNEEELEELLELLEEAETLGDVDYSTEVTEAIEAGGTVTISEDVTLGDVYTKNSVTINANGHKVTVASLDAKEGLSLQNGTFELTGKGIIVVKSVNFEGVTITNTDSFTGYELVLLGDTTEGSIKNSTITVSKGNTSAIQMVGAKLSDFSGNTISSTAAEEAGDHNVLCKMENGSLITEGIKNSTFTGASASLLSINNGSGLGHFDLGAYAWIGGIDGSTFTNTGSGNALELNTPNDGKYTDVRAFVYNVTNSTFTANGSAVVMEGYYDWGWNPGETHCSFFNKVENSTFNSASGNGIELGTGTKIVEFKNSTASGAVGIMLRGNMGMNGKQTYISSTAENSAAIIVDGGYLGSMYDGVVVDANTQGSRGIVVRNGGKASLNNNGGVVKGNGNYAVDAEDANVWVGIWYGEYDSQSSDVYAVHSAAVVPSPWVKEARVSGFEIETSLNNNNFYWESAAYFRGKDGALDGEVGHTGDETGKNFVLPDGYHISKNNERDGYSIIGQYLTRDYYVILHPNGGTPNEEYYYNDASKDINTGYLHEHGTKLNLPENPYTKENYHFLGYVISSDLVPALQAYYGENWTKYYVYLNDASQGGWIHTAFYINYIYYALGNGNKTYIDENGDVFMDLYAHWGPEYVVKHYVQQPDGNYEERTDLEEVKWVYQAGQKPKVMDVVKQDLVGSGSYTVNTDRSTKVETENSIEYFKCEVQDPATHNNERSVIEVYYDRNEVEYTVTIYLQNVDGSEYGTYETETLKGLVGTEISYTPETMDGFKLNREMSVLSATLAEKKDTATARTLVDTMLSAITVSAEGGDDSLIKVYYDREQYTVSYNAGGGTGSVDSIKGYYESNYTVNSGVGLSRDGYTFAGWKDQDGNSVNANSEAKIPAHDVILTAQWNKKQATASSDSGNTNKPTTTGGSTWVWTPETTAAVPYTPATGATTTGRLRPFTPNTQDTTNTALWVFCLVTSMVAVVGMKRILRDGK